MNTQTIFVTLTKITCCREKCGVVFGVDSTTVEHLKNSHSQFYCPNGHSQLFPAKSEAEILRDNLTSERAHADQLKALLRDTEKSLIAHKGHATRIKNRIHKGVCPCCNRTFLNVQRHMATKHPEMK